jgi:hypothetical protein
VRLFSVLKVGRPVEPPPRPLIWLADFHPHIIESAQKRRCAAVSIGIVIAERLGQTALDPVEPADNGDSAASHDGPSEDFPASHGYVANRRQSLLATNGVIVRYVSKRVCLAVRGVMLLVA